MSTFEARIAFDVMVAKQKQDRKREQTLAREQYVTAMQTEISEAVPGRVRVQGLLSLAVAYESTTKTNDCSTEEAKQEKVRAIQTAYKALHDDAMMRLQGEMKSPQEQFQISSEAICCFASMLPWSDGIVHLQQTLPQSVARQNSYRPRPGAPIALMQHVKFSPNVLPALFHPVATNMPQRAWVYPTKLLFDQQKVQQAMSVRRQRLADKCFGDHQQIMAT